VVAEIEADHVLPAHQSERKDADKLPVTDSESNRVARDGVVHAHPPADRPIVHELDRLDAADHPRRDADKAGQQAQATSPTPDQRVPVISTRRPVVLVEGLAVVAGARENRRAHGIQETAGPAFDTPDAR
jgi:hypothetical protein